MELVTFSDKSKRGYMSTDPVVAITEQNAEGQVAEIYQDIRSTLGVPVVNLIWRHLATFPGALEWSWASVKPLYEKNIIHAEASALRRKISVPVDVGLSPLHLKASGLAEDDIYSIKVVLDSYHKSNAMNLISLSSLLAKLNGQSSSSANHVDSLDSVDGNCVDGHMPELIPLNSMPESVKNLVMDINKIGGREQILPSMYRHLANWPQFLALISLLILPFEKKGILETYIESSINEAQMRGALITERLAVPDFYISDVVRSQTKEALEKFTKGPLGKMTVVVSIIMNSISLGFSTK